MIVEIVERAPEHSNQRDRCDEGHNQWYITKLLNENTFERKTQAKK